MQIFCPLAIVVKRNLNRVASSCLGKDAEGAVAPLVVEVVEDGADDAIDALDVDEADHGSGATTNLHLAVLDDVGGGQLSPPVAGEAKKRQQFWQVLLQSPHDPRKSSLPVPLELKEGLARRLGEPMTLAFVRLHSFCALVYRGRFARFTARVRQGRAAKW